MDTITAERIVKRNNYIALGIFLTAKFSGMAGLLFGWWLFAVAAILLTICICLCLYTFNFTQRYLPIEEKERVW